jgi:NADP-dependent 3-hydroxy acid dehydrogenase YdfG
LLSRGEDLIQKWEPADILVNAAGINTPQRSWADTNPAEWDQVIGINLTGTYNCIQSVLPHMRRMKQGQILDINSGAGRKASRMGGLAYSVSKHGMVAIGQTLNEEEWINGLRATEIFIGETNTPILHQRKSLMPPERYEAMLQPEDVALVVEFLVTLPGHILIEDTRPPNDMGPWSVIGWRAEPIPSMGAIPVAMIGRNAHPNIGPIHGLVRRSRYLG